MDGYVSQHKGTLHLLKANSTTFIRREKPFRPPFILIPESDSVFCDGCAKWWPTNRDPDDAESTCDPACSHCEQPAEAHQDGKCLFGPGRYEMARYVITV